MATTTPGLVQIPQQQLFTNQRQFVNVSTIFAPLTAAELKALPANYPARTPCSTQIQFLARFLQTLSNQGPRLFAKPLPRQNKKIEIGSNGKLWYTTRNGTKQYLSWSQVKQCASRGYLLGAGNTQIPCPEWQSIQIDYAKKMYQMPENIRPTRHQPDLPAGIPAATTTTTTTTTSNIMTDL